MGLEIGAAVIAGMPSAVGVASPEVLKCDSAAIDILPSLTQHSVVGLAVSPANSLVTGLARVSILLDQSVFV